MSTNTFYVICDVHTGDFIIDFRSGNTTNPFHALHYDSLEYAESMLAKYPTDFSKNFKVKKVFLEITDPKETDAH